MLTKIGRNQRRRFVTRMTTDQFLWSPPTMSVPGVAGAVRMTGIQVQDVRIQNRAAAAVVGIAVVIPNDQWIAGQWTQATTLFTPDTTDAQDVGASDFALCNTTDNDGFILACRVPFNVLNADVTRITDSAGTPVYEVAYSETNGTGGVQWTVHPIGAIYVEPTFAALGEALIVLPTPGSDNWIRTVTSGDLATGLDAGFYAVRIRATTAPTSQGANATTLTVGRAFGLTEAVATNAVVELFQHVPTPLETDAPARVGIALAAVFENASEGNWVEATVGVVG